MSPSISLRAFCTAVPASPLVESSTTQFDVAAENSALGVDLVDGELNADLLVLSQGGVGSGQRYCPPRS